MADTDNAELEEIELRFGAMSVTPKRRVLQSINPLEHSVTLMPFLTTEIKSTVLSAGEADENSEIEPALGWKTPGTSNSRKRLSHPSPALGASPTGETSAKISCFMSTPATMKVPPHREEVDALAIKGRTILISPGACFDHDTGLSHQESVARLAVLCGPTGVLRDDRFSALHWLPETSYSQANLIDILRVHDFKYHAHLRNRGEAARLSNTCGRLDADTVVSPGSLQAALAAVDAVVTAVDQVVTGQARNVFCAIRPPGHHAGSSGAVHGPDFHVNAGDCSNGFCYFNNAAIAAAYARATYNKSRRNPATGTPPVVIERVAIIDFDIHHGNGTEEIVRNLLPRKQVLPLPGTWAPMEVEVFRPWLNERDADCVFFASVHLANDGFYPGSGLENGSHPYNIVNVPLPSLGAEKLTKLQRQKQSTKLHATASAIFRDAVSTKILPQLRAFRPDLLILSAGFDGHEDDFYWHLDESDYAWLTEQLCIIADELCQGRVVSVLEGGYHVERMEVEVEVAGKRSRRGKGDEVPICAAPVLAKSGSYQQTGNGGLARSVAAHVTALLQRRVLPDL